MARIRDDRPDKDEATGSILAAARVSKGQAHEDEGERHHADDPLPAGPTPPASLPLTAHGEAKHADTEDGDTDHAVNVQPQP